MAIIRRHPSHELEERSSSSNSSLLRGARRSSAWLAFEALLLGVTQAHAQDIQAENPAGAPPAAAVASPSSEETMASESRSQPALQLQARPSSDGRHLMASELMAVENQLAELNQERRDERIVGPIVMVAVGYATFLTSLAVSLGSFAAAEDIQHDTWGDEERFDVNDDGVVDGDDERVLRRVSRGFGVISAMGAGVGIGGTVLLVKRLRERNRNLPEIRRLQRERRELRRKLDYSADLTAQGMRFTLRGTF